jgi:uncharacterized protein (TIGR00661 family)
MPHFLKGKRVIIAPLNWGLGHATRCVPIIDYLLESGAEVVIASDGNALNFLKNSYPNLPFLELPSYNVNYGKLDFVIQTAINFPTYLKAVYQERDLLKSYIENNKIDFVISDNRYGFYHHKVPSVIICHQVCMLPPPGAKWFRPYLYRLHKFFLKPFQKIWIPDFESESFNLSGDMSHNVSLPENIQYIGAQTRMEYYPIENKDEEVDILVMLSGVEPQRSYLEERIIQQAKKIKNRKFLFLKGIVDGGEKEIESHIKILPYASGKQLNDLLLKAKIVICRSGYSSVMDLYYLGKKVIFIPSKGQTEQEYLAELASERGYALKVEELEMNLEEAIKKVELTKGLPIFKKETELIEKAFKDLAS